MGTYCFSLSRFHRSQRLALMLVAFGSLWTSTQVLAETQPLPPQTSIRLTIVQWIAAKGTYERWDALGGDFKISDESTVSLPVIGTIPVGKLDESALSADIAKRLKAKIGLVDMPLATVSIIDYPPVYVVGDVKTPGEYHFRTGLTVLQCLAMSGGEFRPEGGAVADKVGFVGALREMDNAILRSEIRIARLSAEMSGAKEMRFNANAVQGAAAETIYLQEKAIFVARANLLERQSKSYTELRDLLSSEIENLVQKSKGTDADIDSVEKELRNVKGMVEKGIALPSRQADLERMLRSYYAGRLDLATAIMRARQGISEASRNLEGLYDKNRTDVAGELQAEQASLDQLKMKRDTTQKQLLDALSQGTDPASADSPVLAFTVSRRVDGMVEQMAASENTLLQPGDVVRVVRSVRKTQDVTSAAESTPLAFDMLPGTSQ